MISVGALTHSAPAANIALDLELVGVNFDPKVAPYRALESRGRATRSEARGSRRASRRPLVMTMTTASTNDDAKRAAHAAPEGAAFVADTQTSGRGRLGRVWHSPRAKLYASFVLRPELSASSAQLVTFAAGLAVVDAVAKLVPSPAPPRTATRQSRVGRPSRLLEMADDVLVDGRKLRGSSAKRIGRLGA